MSVWRGLLRTSARACDSGSYGVIDATFFDRVSVNQHRSDRHVCTLNNDGPRRFGVVFRPQSPQPFGTLASRHPDWPSSRPS